MATVGSTAANSAQDIIAGLSRPKSEPVKEEQGSKTQFLALLTAQLKNQDPMNPLENAEVTSQLAQISTVDGIERLNTTLASMMSGQQANETMQAAALVGRGVLIPGKGLALSDAGALGGFSLSSPADKVVATIKDANGLEVAAVDLGSFEAGTHNFTWDGSTLDGVRAANGKYTVSITASVGGEPVGAEALQLGAVSSVIRGPHGTDLQVGDLGIFKMSEIKQIL